MATQRSAKGRTLSGALGTMPRANAQARQQMVAGMQGGNVYAGGSPNFDERTGRFIQQPHTGTPVYIPERSGMPPHSGSPIYTPENAPPRHGPGFQAPLERVSPGIYRNASGDLVNSSGGRLPGNVYRQPGYAQYDPNQPQSHNLTDVARGALQGVGAGIGGGFRSGSNYQPMPRPMLNPAIQNIGQAYGNFVGAGQPMPRPVVNYNEPMMYSQGGGYQQAMQDAFAQAGMQRQPISATPPQPGMQMQYGMTGKPIGWGFGQNQS